MDLEKEVSEVQQSAPFLIVTGRSEAENCQFFICCEQDVYLESTSLTDAVIDLIATYFVYDVVYPKPLKSIFIFLQHYVLDLKDEQQVPPLALKLVKSLKNIE